MDLTKQPPRRPSNAGIAGIVGLARLKDKALGHNEELLGSYKYGDNSGLDCEVLAFINMAADEFAVAAGRMSDVELGELAMEKAVKSASEIDSFNREQLEREPQDELHKRLLVERLEAYAPGNTSIKTVLASIELDDWGAFREGDLTQRPPRTPYLRSVLGIVGLARLGDKARAAKCDRLGEYRYGDSSILAAAILQFIGVGQEEFMEGAWENPNDVELGEWILARSTPESTAVSAFNAGQVDRGRSDDTRERFLMRRGQICPGRTDIDTWFELIDCDDETSFGLVDLTRHAPRSPYATDLGGLVALARMADKGWALIGDTLGEYWYGDDSGIDRQLLEFLGLSQDEFTAGLRGNRTDQAVAEWLGERLDKPAQIAALNDRLHSFGPGNERQWRFLSRSIAKLDPTRTEIASFLALTRLEDQVSFARLKADV